MFSRMSFLERSVSKCEVPEVNKIVNWLCDCENFGNYSSSSMSCPSIGPAEGAGIKLFPRAIVSRALDNSGEEDWTRGRGPCRMESDHTGMASPYHVRVLKESEM